MRSRHDIEHYRDLLRDLQQVLLQAEETGQQAEETVELDQTRVGRLSRMDAMRAQAMSVETGRRRRAQLQQIENALVRIEQGDFGECQECGQAINPARLDVDPVAMFCIDCASLRERD
jgi:DnaK suppressor protein